MISSKTFDAFLALVRQGIGHESHDLSQEIDWTAIKALEDTHGLSAVVLDGLNEVSTSNSQLSTQIIVDWRGNAKL